MEFIPIYWSGLHMDASEERVNALFLSFVSSKWRKIITPIAAIAVISALLFLPKGQADNNSFVMSEQNPFPELIEQPSEEEIETIEAVVPVVIIVDVKGAVLYPGVYSMQQEDRVIDAIRAAGGYLPNADSRLLNHAMKVVDELVIYVPVEGEEPLNHATSPLIGTVAPQDDGKININTADAEQLMTIPGIGPSKAAAIIQYREEQGLFKMPESLMDVSGIGQKTFEKLAPLVTVN
ncbi:helix-hairpin-helix domain-containing protein [Sporosarcina beigongshangi]|uniref:helix-hairpin-helix domain-containing protein n=1 Tax=Sporosarcina beigongshangi TaxID=2782538 RepID=UPI001E4B4A89|nr:helix-hairpin-helix domain-containing protein [Sporosarcina beigongshangi]